MPKKRPRPRPLSGAGPGQGPGARVFRGPVRPVMNSRMQVARGKGGNIVCASAALAGLERVGEQLGGHLGVTDGLPKSRIVEGYEVFSILMCVRTGGGCSGPCVSLPGRWGAGVWRWVVLGAGGAGA